MDFDTIQRRNSDWQEGENNPRKRTRSYVESFPPQSPTHYVEKPEGIVNQLYHSITQFCQDVLFNLQNSEEARTKEPMTTPLYRVLDDVYTSFITWGTDFNVRKGSLDDRLEGSRELRQITIEILIAICDIIENELHPTMVEILKDIHSCPILRLESKLERIKMAKKDAGLYAHITAELDYDDSTKSTSDSDADEPATPSDTSSLEEVIGTLKDEVEALIGLGPSHRRPVPDTIVDTQAATPQLEGSSDENRSYLTFLDGIRRKLPQCHERLAVAVSKIVCGLTIRLQLERQANASVKSAKPVNDGISKDEGYETATRQTSQQDGLGSFSDTYAETLGGYADNHGVISTPFPSQPKNRKTGEAFDCVACGRELNKTPSETFYRRHLLGDLQPWICCQILCDCNFKSFSTRDEWLKHLRAIHEAHPKWDVENCPFCQQVVPGGNNDMIRHVERHLRQLSLAALGAKIEDQDDGSKSEPDLEIDGLDNGKGEMEGGEAVTKPTGNPSHTSEQQEKLEDHPVYQIAAQESDGLWHCPWEGEGYCHHQPSMLKEDQRKFIKDHLRHLRCKVDGCASNNNQPFATREILYLHELKEHGMHKGGGRFLCTSPGCGRSREGNGFMNQWLQLEHIKNVHDNIPDIDVPEGPSFTKTLYP